MHARGATAATAQRGASRQRGGSGIGRCPSDPTKRHYLPQAANQAGGDVGNLKAGVSDVWRRTQPDVDYFSKSADNESVTPAPGNTSLT